MGDGSVKFKVGQFDCQIISDGFLTIGPGGRLDVGCLFLRSGNHKILIDTGCGISPQVNCGKLLENLQKEGIKAPDIDIIIHTHAHSDHIGGNTDANGKLVFSKARHMIHKIEWDYWMKRISEPETEPPKGPPMVPVARKNLLPLKDRIDLIGNKEEILPGIKFSLAPGHTPGNIVLKLSSGSSELLCIGDLIHDTKEFTNPDMFKMVDYSAEQALQSRNTVLNQAAKARTPVFACHFSHPGLGYMMQKNGILGWEPQTFKKL